MKKIGYTLLVLSLVIAGSCRKVSDPVLSYGQNDAQAFEHAGKSFENQFTDLWTALNCNYGIWDYEASFGLDWDDVYEKYLPQFKALDQKETVTDEELKKIYTEVVNPLHDGHLLVQVQNLKTGSFLNIFPSSDRLLETRKEALTRDTAFKLDMSAYLALDEGPMRITESQVPAGAPLKKAGETFASAYRLTSPIIDAGVPSPDAPEMTKLLYELAVGFQADFFTFVSTAANQGMAAAIKLANNMVLKHGLLAKLLGITFSPVDPGLGDKDPGLEYYLFDDAIPYLRISDFSLTPWLGDQAYAELNQLHDPGTDAFRAELQAAHKAWLDAITRLKTAGKLKGVILDIRTNGGGYSNDFQYLVGALVPSGGFSFFKVRTKGGIGRYDYLPAMDFYYPTLKEDHTVVDQEPIVVLCNSRSVSMAEISSAAAKSLPNGYLLGSRTWGALSSLTTDQTRYTDQYAGVVGEMGKTPFYAYIPRRVSIFPEGILEGVGITPDIEVDLDLPRLRNEHLDNQLERAVDFILNGARN